MIDFVIEKVCKGCGRLFTISNVKGKHKKFCCGNCRYVSYTKPKVRVCPVCNIQFSAEDKRLHRYCSVRCKRKLQVWRLRYKQGKRLSMIAKNILNVR